MNTRSSLLLSSFSLALAAAWPAAATAQVSWSRTSVHDPSIVVDTLTDASTETFYVFGSHMGVSRTTDLRNWTSNVCGGESTSATLFGRRQADGTVKKCSYNDAFRTHEVTRVRINATDSVDFGNFDAAAWNTAVNDYNVQGNMWAPDVTYNPVMKKWLYYVSLNGYKWNSVIVCMAADKVTGPYVYQGPVVFSGFDVTDESPSFKQTDLPIVLGDSTSLPERYQRGESWGTYWPHAIDPCVYTDTEGNYWLAYGSWSGGIYTLRLDANTGLRDYTVTYAAKNNTTANVTEDPYFGRKLAGGYYVSGEGPYITRLGDWYYLFMSYGFYSPEGGYEMRLFRSQNPDGPFVDQQGVSAIYYSWLKNYGTDASTDRGYKLLGNYRWDVMSTAEIAQGHNSAMTDREGRSFVVYHTKFNNGTAGHAVRVHQLLLNAEGWPCAAPYEFKGETVTSDSVATVEAFTAGDVAGTYQLLGHPYRIAHERYAYSRPSEISLAEDGTISGAYSGTWSLTPGTSYITLQIGSFTYSGVLLRQTIDYIDRPALCISAMSATNTANKSPLGRALWATKALPTEETGDCYTSLRAYYDFEHNLTNALDSTQQGTALAEASGTAPTFGDSLRAESTVLHQYFGYPSATSSSYVHFPNALQGAAATEQGATISLFVNRVDANQWDAIWGCVDTDNSDGVEGRLYMTANTYLGFNGTGGWFDANYPTTAINDLETAAWHLLTLTCTSTGWTLYLDGQARYTESSNRSFNKSDDFSDYASVLRLLASAADFYLGYGSWWGSAPIYVDDLTLYDRALTAADVHALYVAQLTDTFRPDVSTSAIEAIRPDRSTPSAAPASGTYDLQGRRVARPAHGLYIVNGKRVFLK
jgi:beta-xylosidase